MKVYILYENDDWMIPLRRELNRASVPFEEWFIQDGHVDLTCAPPPGVFINRISPSSHTRDHRESISFARELLAWLESYERRVINGSRAFAMETSKVRQYSMLRKANLRTPRTIAVSGDRHALLEAGDAMSLPFITKHNCGGKGLGVQLFRTREGFDEFVDTGNYEKPIDNIMLLQEYIVAPEPFVTRVEIVGEEFLYAIKIDTSRGFELCPAECCEIGDAFCPTTDTDTDATATINRQTLFSLRDRFDDPIIEEYKSVMRANDIDVAGFEFIEDAQGNKFTYDINCTTNYSPAVEDRHGLNGMASIVQLAAKALQAAQTDGASEQGALGDGFKFRERL